MTEINHIHWWCRTRRCVLCIYRGNNLQSKSYIKFFSDFIISQISMIFNEIAQARWNPSDARMKSANADEIKSVLSLPAKRDFITKWFHPTEVGFNPSVRTDLVEKKHPLSADKGCFFSGDPDEIRTRVTAVKGRCLRPLDHRALNGGGNGTWTYDLPGMNRML